MPYAVVVSGTESGVGATTTSVQLARMLAAAGSKVILIEADPTRPAVAEAFGVSATHGVWSVMRGATGVGDALARAPGYSGNLHLLLAGGDVADADEGISPSAASDLLAEAKELADWVIVDLPPLSELVNALALAQNADAALLVARVDKTRLADIAEVLELADRHEVAATGFVLIGAPGPTPPRAPWRVPVPRARPKRLSPPPATHDPAR
jgi:tyrosine-protein kinase Etk/Wzc